MFKDNENKNCLELTKQLEVIKQRYKETIQENENLKEDNEFFKETNSYLQYMLDDVIEKVLKDDDQKEYYYTELKKKFTTKLDEIINYNDKYRKALDDLIPILDVYASPNFGKKQADGTYKFVYGTNQFGDKLSLTYDPKLAMEGLNIINKVKEQ